MKTHTFKTLINKDPLSEMFQFNCIDPDQGLCSTNVPSLYGNGATIEILSKNNPDIDFSQVELKTVEVTIK